jgi:two-component system, OmpR family, alkaline phosphatase synthesis response regulator PhoP
MARVLLVEDEANLRASLGFILEREGFEVMLASAGEEALAMARAAPPDVVVLDINLPGINGFETCERLRRDPLSRGARIVMISARAGVDDMLRGFETFADDYVTKPFHPKVLLARIQALLRRRDEPAKTPGRIDLGSLSIDSVSREVQLDGAKIELTRTEFDVLFLLAAHPNRVFTRANILDRVRDGETDATERAVDFQVASLRKKLGSARVLVETVRGVGYKLRTDG